jgi:hypothetical protein
MLVSVHGKGPRDAVQDTNMRTHPRLKPLIAHNQLQSTALDGSGEPILTRGAAE